MPPKRKAATDGNDGISTKRTRTTTTRQAKTTQKDETTSSVENVKPAARRGRPPKSAAASTGNALAERTNGIVAGAGNRKQTASGEHDSEDELLAKIIPADKRGRLGQLAAEDSPDELSVAEQTPKKRGPGRPRKTETAATKKATANGVSKPRAVASRLGAGRTMKARKEKKDADELGDTITLVPRVPTTPKKRGRPPASAKAQQASPTKSVRKAPAQKSAARDEWDPEDSSSDNEPQIAKQLAAETPTRRGRRPTVSATVKAKRDAEPTTPSRRTRVSQPSTLPPPKIRGDFLFSAKKNTPIQNVRPIDLTEDIQSSDDELEVQTTAERIAALTPAAKKPIPKKAVRAAPKVVGSEFQKRDMVHTLKAHLLKKLCRRPGAAKRDNLVGLDDEYGRVYHLLEQTVAAGEGNSMLLIGSRGVGKSMLVDTAIEELQESYKGDFLVVRLNGFFQTDDKLASREIWRQLGVEMDSEEGTGIDGVQPKTSNFGDTLSSILAVLSHPSEHANEDDAGLAENKTAVSVIFILDEFDLFVTHPRQALLYNLFDIAQARKAPIAVLGLTSRIDVVESLEKRVKSRFSHRSVHIKLPGTLERFWETCRKGLEVDIEQIEEEAKRDKEEIEYFEKWNEDLEELYDEEADFRNFVRRIYAQSKDVRAFYNAMLLPITSLTPSSPFLTADKISSHPLAAPELKLNLLSGLSDLELSLLIAAARIEIITDSENINFNMAYDEYSRMSGEMRIQSSIASSALSSQAKIWGRDVAMAAWEKLAEYELIVPGMLGGGGRENRMWRVEVSLRDAGRAVGKKVAWLAKWCKI